MAAPQAVTLTGILQAVFQVTLRDVPEFPCIWIIPMPPFRRHTQSKNQSFHPQTMEKPGSLVFNKNFKNRTDKNHPRKKKKKHTQLQRPSISIQLKGFCGMRVTAVSVPTAKRRGRRKPINTAAKVIVPQWKRNKRPRTSQHFWGNLRKTPQKN